MSALHTTQAISIRMLSGNLLSGQINLSYLSVSASARIFLILVASFSLLHFFAPENSFAGHVFYQVRKSPLPTMSLITVITLLSGIYYYKQASTHDLKITADELIFTRGNLLVESIRLPRLNINHVTLERSFIERLLGLSTLKLFSPGNHKPTIVLNSLHVSAAEQLYTLLKVK